MHRYTVYRQTGSLLIITAAFLMAEKHYNKKPLEFALIEYARGLIFAHNPGFSR
jgi:hypothetical protein